VKTQNEKKSRFLALDFGAESGRGELITLSGNKVQIEEIHRFPNRPVNLCGTLFWDFPFLFAELLATLQVCADKDLSLNGIGVSTWGVDFGLLGEDGKILANPVHYRDGRTHNIHDYSDVIMSRDAIFAATACEPWAISSLFQLISMQKDHSPILEIARSFLNMPDLFNYGLTGKRVSERSIASTANLMQIDGEWCPDVIDRFQLPDIFEELVEPGTVIGNMHPEIVPRPEMANVPVIATCSHDTAAVAAAIPAGGDNWAFLSSGTWSILGRLRSEPVTTREFLENGFSNEYTLGGWFLCCNIIGLWLIQELYRKWDTSADPWNYDRMMAEAFQAKSGAIIDVADKCLLAPDDMEASLLDLALRFQQPLPQTRGELIRCALESLALEYAYRLELLCSLSQENVDSMYLVGGGSANELLCQLTANACRITIYAGAQQCTSVGNALTQAYALGIIKNPAEIRNIMRNSFELKTYEPMDSSFWMDRLEQYKRLTRTDRN
jgi:sugar (pentulose or hexulose) kinase